MASEKKSSPTQKGENGNGHHAEGSAGDQQKAVVQRDPRSGLNYLTDAEIRARDPFGGITHLMAPVD